MNLSIDGKPVEAARVFRLRRGDVGPARKAAVSDGIDNIFFRSGDDTYVASGKFSFLQSSSLGKEVVVAGRPAGVLTSYDRDASDQGKRTLGLAISLAVLAIGAYARNAGLLTLGTLAALFTASSLTDGKNPDLLRVYAEEALQ